MSGKNDFGSYDEPSEADSVSEESLEKKPRSVCFSYALLILTVKGKYQEG